MKTLIIPAAGQSSRFPGMRPKWLLTMRDGQLMIEHAIRCMTRINKFDRIIVTCQAEHLKRFTSEATLNCVLSEAAGQAVELFQLSAETRSQSETVSRTLKEMKVDGAFLIKDCDNEFEFSWSGGDEIAVLDIATDGVRDVKGKSYVRTDPLGIVQNIVEKHIISNIFCCGAYGFSSAENFIMTFDELASESEIYVSHVIFQLILNGGVFSTSEARDYSDWGTIEAYRRYMRGSLTIFCDIDGVLFKNGSKFGAQGWDTTPIDSNMLALKALTELIEIHLVITTSRPESERTLLEKTLQSYGIIAKSYLMGLPHSKRVLINDYSATNSFPTALAINIERDTNSLGLMLESLRVDK